MNISSILISEQRNFKFESTLKKFNQQIVKYTTIDGSMFNNHESWYMLTGETHHRYVPRALMLFIRSYL